MIARPSIICFTLAAILALVDSFSLPLPVTQNRVGVLPRSRCQHQMLPDVSSFLTAVEIFDGSSIVDPIVVSNVFWASLKGKIVAVVIGQILATIAFAILSSFLATQLSQVGQFVTKTLFPSKEDYDNNNKARPFIKANEIPSSSSVNKNSPTPDFRKLVICIAIDVIGSASELVPVIGEFSDVIYAPIAATILRNLYSSNIVFALEFAEEILPFTDILPLATICWVTDTFFGESDLAKVLQLGKFSPNGWTEDAIDTKVESSSSQMRSELPTVRKDGER